jgi:hypothetical protein
MRLWSINTISWLVLLAALAALAAISGLRHAVLGAVRPQLYNLDFRDVAQEHPDDPHAWLAALPEEWYGEVPLHEREPFYERASQLAPDSAAPHFIYAGLALGGIGGISLRREEENALYPDDYPLHLKIHQRYLRQSERDRLTRASDALERAAELDPENAAIDALRITIALIEHEDAHAFDLLRSTLPKRRWSLYRREFSQAAYEGACRYLPPDVAVLTGALAHPDTLFGTHFRHLASVLAGFATLAEQGGDHEEAISLRRSVTHLGLLMLSGEATIIDGYTGWGVWDAAASRPLTDAEREAAEAEAGLARRQSSGESAAPARAGAIRKARCAKLAAYLRERGEDGLASDVLGLAEAHEEWNERVALVVWQTSLPVDRQLALDFAIEQSSHALVACLAVLLACGLAALVLCRRGRPPRTISWPRTGWLLIVWGCLATVYLAGIFGPGGRRLRVTSQVPGELMPEGWTCPVWGDYFAVVGLPVLLLSVALVILFHRDRHPEARPAGMLEHYLGTSAAVLLPLAALACLVTISFATSRARLRSHDAERHRAIMEEGELAHYGLTIPLESTSLSPAFPQASP